MANLSSEATDGMPVIVAVRPEEFSIRAPGDGLTCQVHSKVFLGKYITYGLTIPEELVLPKQPSIEFSQDLGHAEKILETGDTVTLRPNARKINVFTADGSHSLMEGVVRHE